MPLELIDLGDKLQDFRRDRDVPDLVGANIHLYPFLPNYYQRHNEYRFTPIYPPFLRGRVAGGPQDSLYPQQIQANP